MSYDLLVPSSVSYSVPYSMLIYRADARYVVTATETLHKAVCLLSYNLRMLTRPCFLQAGHFPQLIGLHG